MKKTQILIFFSGLGKLEHELIYWFTTIKSQIAKKHFKETRKNGIYCCYDKNGKKISVSYYNENDKLIEGFILADSYNQYIFNR